MELDIKVCNSNYGKYSTISVEDISNDFLPDFATEPIMGRFKKSEVKAINVLKHNKVDSETTICLSLIEIDDVETFKIEEDGWYVLHHVVLPTKAWFDLAKQEGGVFNQYNTIYYIDENKIIKYNNGEFTEVSVEEILEVNTLNTTISRICLNHFSICHLMLCYVKLVEHLLSLNIKCESNLPNDLTFKRDILWMAINVIKYHVEFGDMEGATLQLDKLNYCNGFCKEINNYVSSGCCGQSKA